MMFDALKKQSLKWIGAQMRDFICPSCGFSFKPFQDRELTSFNDNIICPQCGYSVPMKRALQVQKEVKANPPGPIAQPAGTKIEKKAVSDTGLLFYIPASGRWGGLLFFAIIWNAMSWFFFITVLTSFLHGRVHGSLWAGCFVFIFPLIGLGVVYAALRLRFAVHLLYLGPDRIRLQRQFFGHKKNFDLLTPGVVSVKKTEFYQQNYQPVYGVEIRAAKGKIRFGSALSEEEKNWLCWEIREFVKTVVPDLK